MNPFIELYQNPVSTLTAAAYVVTLLGLLVSTWWAAGRNALYLFDNYQNGWLVLVPKWYAFRVVLMCGIIAVDLLLIAAIIWTVSL